jgi:hypothetical protein
MKAIVYPIVTGKDYCEPDPPLPLDRASKAAAVRALHDSGYRVMWVGGLFDVTTTTAEELRDARSDTTRVSERERELGYELPDEAEIVKYLVTVYPSR